MRAASLGMYDAPWLAQANDALWAWLAARLRTVGVAEVPGTLDRTRPAPEVVRDPRLLLGQTCGYPLMTALHGTVRLVATPCYDLPGCEGALYRSAIVVAEDDPAQSLAELRGSVAAVNGPDSNSGMNVLRHAVAPLAVDGRFFADMRLTGAHLDSLAAVASGAARVAAIDCVTLGLAARHAPGRVAGTRILGWSVATPGLPLVTSVTTGDEDLARLRAGLDSALSAPELAGMRATLGLVGFDVLGLEDYAPILDIEREAAAQGYPTLA